MKTLVVLLVLLAGCVKPLPAPTAPLLMTLPPPVTLPDQSLLPAAGPAFLPPGKTLSYSASCFSNEQAAALAGELKRLDGRDEALQTAEREQAAVPMAATNEQLTMLAARYQEAYAQQQKIARRLPYWISGSFVAGALLVTAAALALP